MTDASMMTEKAGKLEGAEMPGKPENPGNSIGLCGMLLLPAYSDWPVPVALLLPFVIILLADSAVILATLSAWKLPRLAIYKKIIFKVWWQGCLALYTGSIIWRILTTIIASFVPNDPPHTTVAAYLAYTAMRQNIFRSFQSAYAYHPFLFFVILLATVVVMIIAGVWVYEFSLNRAFKTMDMDAERKERLALRLALFTAPFVAPHLILLLLP